jgi:hypothetical protein
MGVVALESSNRRNPMPKFVIERQYLVPMYQHIVVEAANLEEACKKAISDDIDWDTQEMDCDNAARPLPKPRSCLRDMRLGPTA